MVRQAIILCALLCSLWAQASLSSPAQRQVERGIDALYNYQFDRAIMLLDSARLIDVHHPVVPFTLIAAKWLKSQTEQGYDSSYAVLYREVAKTIPIYEEMLKNSPGDAECHLYLGSTFGIRARVALAQKDWIEVLYSGYQGYRHVMKAFKHDPHLMDVYMPIGSLEYYSCKSPEIIQWLAGIFGIEVNCEQGLEDLKVAARESHYSWIESSNMLTYAYLYLEKDYDEALYWVDRLVEEYPGHPFFAFLQGEALAKSGRWEELDRLMPTLEAFTEQEMFLPRNESELKLTYLQALQAFDIGEYETCVERTSWMINNYHMEFDWMLGFAHILRGKCHDILGNREEAIRDYRITANLDNHYPEVKEARKLMKTPFFRDDRGTDGS